MIIDQVRQYSTSLPEVTEEPHHHFSSFRVAGKIFVTVPPGDTHIHVLVDEQQREVALKLDPQFLEALHWGKKIVGLRVALAKANLSVVKRLIIQAWQYKAPKRLVRSD